MLPRYAPLDSPGEASTGSFRSSHSLALTCPLPSLECETRKRKAAGQLCQLPDGVGSSALDSLLYEDYGSYQEACVQVGGSQSLLPAKRQRQQSGAASTVAGSARSSVTHASAVDLATGLSMLQIPRCSSTESVLFCEEGLDNAPRSPGYQDASPQPCPASPQIHTIGSWSSFDSGDGEDMDSFAFHDTPSPSGAYTHREVPAASLVGCHANLYGFSPATLSLGTTYFERLAARDPHLLQVARASPDFAGFVDTTPPDLNDPVAKPVGLPVPVAKQVHVAANDWLLTIHLACIYVAAKNIEFVPYKRLLQTILGNTYRTQVSAEAAATLEMEILEGLKWRLGPFYRVDP